MARIVHGDLKPANFLIVEGAIKLIDFGIAKAIGNDTLNINRGTDVIGTMSYLAPEAITSQSGGDGAIKIGTPSDIWSLGCILYQMVYGEPPFSPVKNPQLRMLAIINPNHKIPFPALQNPYLMEVLKGCLERDPARRPTIPQLLEHPFLHPERVGQNAAARAAPAAAVMSKDALLALFSQLATLSPHLATLCEPEKIASIHAQLESGELDLASVLAGKMAESNGPKRGGFTSEINNNNNNNNISNMNNISNNNNSNNNNVNNVVNNGSNRGVVPERVPSLSTSNIDINSSINNKNGGLNKENAGAGVKKVSAMDLQLNSKALRPVAAQERPVRAATGLEGALLSGMRKIEERCKEQEQNHTTLDSEWTLN